MLTDTHTLQRENAWREVQSRRHVRGRDICINSSRRLRCSASQHRKSISCRRVDYAKPVSHDQLLCLEAFGKVNATEMQWVERWNQPENKLLLILLFIIFLHFIIYVLKVLYIYCICLVCHYMYIYLDLNIFSITVDIQLVLGVHPSDYIFIWHTKWSPW